MLEMACENEIARCVRGYHVYKDIHGQQQLGKCLCVAGSRNGKGSQPTCKLYSRKIFLYVFLCTNENKENYGNM